MTTHAPASQTGPDAPASDPLANLTNTLSILPGAPGHPIADLATAPPSALDRSPTLGALVRRVQAAEHDRQRRQADEARRLVMAQARYSSD
jgi:hypothetical protein